MNAELLKKNPNLILDIVHAYAINDLEIDEDIKQLVLDNLDLIPKMNPTRTYEVFKSIMNTPNPTKYIREFKEVFFKLIPGLEKTYGFKQNNPWHIYDVFEHTMHVIDNTYQDERLRIAALFHDLGKPVVYKEETKEENGKKITIGHFYNHNKVSKIIFEEFAKTMQIPKEEKELISKLIIYHDYNLSTRPSKIQEYIDDLGVENIPLLFAIKRADNKAQNPEKSSEVLKKLDETERLFNEYISKMPKEEKPPTIKKTN